MLSIWNEVNKRIKARLVTGVDATYPKLALTSKDESDSPSTYPCLFVNSLGEPTASTDMGIGQNAIESTIELQAYSAPSPNGTQTEARKIIDAAGDVMLSMGYELITGPYQRNNNYFRTVARFRRTYASGDIL